MENKKISKYLQPSVFVMDASAGSGKTYCLAKHYIRLLLDKKATPNQMETILAITFTNKASRQMKERIIDFLKRIALDGFDDPEMENDILSGISVSREEARHKALEAMDKIVSSYNYFQVKTIDSFINTILLGCSYQIGLSSSFEIRDDRRDYLALSLDHCIENANHDKKTKGIFEAFLKQYIYLEGKNSWLPKKDISGLLESMFFQTNVYGGSFVKVDLGDIDLYKEKQKLLKLYRKVLEDAPEGLNGTFRNTLAKFLDENNQTFDFGDIASRANLTKDFLPMNKNVSAPVELENTWKTIRKKTTELAEAEAVSYFNCYIDIFELVYNTLRTYAKKEDAIFLEELNYQAKYLIQQNGITVPELYYHLASRLKHYLIDEFQDTSLLQWLNLYLMIEDAISTGGSLFYVGDKKQAIFRFRGGDVALFDGIREKFKEYASLEFLLSNYRSAKEIVEFNNLVFSQDNLKQFLFKQQESADNKLKYFNNDDIQEILDVFSSSLQKYQSDKHGLVKVETVLAKEVEERDQVVKARVLEVILEATKESGFQKNDIAILCRSNDEVEKVSAWLIGQNIPVESEKTLNIKNNRLIKELLALLNFLNSPIDNLSFSTFILGDLFLKAAGLTEKEVESFLFSYNKVAKKEKVGYVYREFRNNYPQVWKDLLDTPFRDIGFIGIYELVIDLLDRFQVFKNFPQEQGFFMHFLQLLKDSEEERPGIFDFLDYFSTIDESKLFVNSSGADAVKLMTIHKSKGLGFEVVIIPFLYLDINDLGPQAEGGKVSHDLKNPNHLLLRRLDQKYALLSEAIKDKYRKEYKNEFIDELNTIYVSLTRAKSELYVFLSSGISRVNNVARFLIPQDYFKSEKRTGKNSARASEDITLQIDQARYWKWNKFLDQEFCDKDVFNKRQAILDGEILHSILSGIGNISGADKSTIVNGALAKTKGLFPQVDNFSQYEKLIYRVLDCDKFHEFFYLKKASIFQEKEIADRAGNAYRIDRLIVNSDKALVVDYKLKLDEGRDYRRQVLNYMDIIRPLFPGLEIKGFLLSLNEFKVEEVNG